MIQVGDKLLCVESALADGKFPEIKEGTYYIANALYSCKCGLAAVDVGLQFITPMRGTPCCPRCDAILNIGLSPFYDIGYFRKIEPSYKVIEIHSEILQEAREIIRTKETIAL